MNAQKRREIDNWLFKSRSDLGFVLEKLFDLDDCRAGGVP